MRKKENGRNVYGNGGIKGRKNGVGGKNPR